MDFAWEESDEGYRRELRDGDWLGTEAVARLPPPKGLPFLDRRPG